MSKSVLSGRIDVCNSISKLNKDGCLDVIRLLQNVMGLDDLNQFTSKIFMNYSNNLTIDQITHFENEIKLTLSNQNFVNSHSQSHKNSWITNKDVESVEFPLLRLPIDLIRQTSLYLHEKDIFNFEKCCRSFYQMINNTSYLNLSNNFKKFTITKNIGSNISNTM